VTPLPRTQPAADAKKQTDYIELDLRASSLLSEGEVARQFAAVLKRLSLFRSSLVGCPSLALDFPCTLRSGHVLLNFEIMTPE